MMRHFSFSLIRQLVVSLVQLIIIAYIVQTHGIASYGIYAQILAVGAVSAVFLSFGLGQAILYYENVNGSLLRKINVKMAITELALLNGMLLLSLWFLNQAFFEVSNFNIYLLYACNTLVLNLIQSIFQSRGDYKTVNYLLILFYIIPLIIFISSNLIVDISFEFILSISGIAQLIVCLLFSAFMIEAMPIIDENNMEKVKLFTSLRYGFKIGKNATLANGLNILNKKIIVIVAPFFLAGEVVGLLGILSALYEKALLPVTALNFVSLRNMTQTSHCTESFSKDYGYKFRVVMLVSFSVVLCIGILVTAFLPLISEFYFFELAFISLLCVLIYIFRIQSRLLSNIFASLGEFYSNAQSTGLSLFIFSMSLITFNAWYAIGPGVFLGCILLSSFAMMFHRWILVKTHIKSIQYRELFIVNSADIFFIRNYIYGKFSLYLK